MSRLTVVKTKNLSFLIAVWMAVAIAGSMAAYAVYQFFTMPGMTVKELFLHHFWHVLALGSVIYVLCWFLFKRIVLRPLTCIYLHLYAVGGGKLELLELNSNVTEIRTIVEGVNLMLTRLKQGLKSNALEDSELRISEIKDLLRNLGTSEPEKLDSALEKLEQLERNLLPIFRTEAHATDSTEFISADFT